MNKKKLNETIKLFERLKELAEEIPMLVKVAEKLSNINDNCEVRLSIEVIDKGENEHDQQFVRRESLSRFVSPFDFIHRPNTTKSTAVDHYAGFPSFREILTEKIDEQLANQETSVDRLIDKSTALQILQFLVSVNQNERDKILADLKSNGIVLK